MRGLQGTLSQNRAFAAVCDRVVRKLREKGRRVDDGHKGGAAHVFTSDNIRALDADFMECASHSMLMHACFADYSLLYAKSSSASPASGVLLQQGGRHCHALVWNVHLAVHVRLSLRRDSQYVLIRHGAPDAGPIHRCAAFMCWRWCMAPAHATYSHSFLCGAFAAEHCTLLYFVETGAKNNKTSTTRYTGCIRHR